MPNISAGVGSLHSQPPGDETQPVAEVVSQEPLWREGAYPLKSLPWAWACPAMASMMASWEYMLMGVLYCAWMMVALPPSPFTSMGLWVDRAESFRALGLKRSW